MLIKQLCDDIVIPTLDYMTHCTSKTMNSNNASQLLLLTAACESLCGKFLTQHPQGTALGIWQIEPTTHYDLHENYLAYNPEILEMLRGLKFSADFGANEPNLVGNLYYSTAIARLIYWRYPEALPKLDDYEAMWEYYKKYYNSTEGKATRELFFKHAQYCAIIDVDIVNQLLKEDLNDK